jgi:hypothetical protein
MRTSGVASDRPLTWILFVVAFGFLVILAGGPMELLSVIQRVVEATIAFTVQLARSL